MTVTFGDAVHSIAGALLYDTIARKATSPSESARLVGSIDDAPTAKKVAVASGARADVALTHVPGEIRNAFAGRLKEISNAFGCDPAEYSSLVGVAAHDLRSRMTPDSWKKTFDRFVSSGSAVLASIGMTSSLPGEKAVIAESAFPPLPENASSSLDLPPLPGSGELANLALYDEPLPEIDMGTSTNEKAKEQSVDVSGSSPRVRQTTPDIDEVFSGSERRQGTRPNCTFYATVRAIEEVYDAKLTPDTPERLWALYRNPGNPEFSKGTTIPRAVEFVGRLLGSPIAITETGRDKSSIVKALSKGNVVVASISPSGYDLVRNDPSGRRSVRLSESMTDASTDRLPKDVVDAILAGNDSAFRVGHAIVVTDYDKSRDAFIVSNSWGGAGEKGYILVDSSKLSSVLDGSAYSFSRGTKDPADIKKPSEFDPEGEKPEVHRSVATEAVAHMRASCAGIELAIEKAIASNGSGGMTSRDRDAIVKYVTNRAECISEQTDTAIRYLSEKSGMKLAVENPHLSRIVALLQSGDYASALAETKKMDSFFVTNAGPKFSAAGNVVEMRAIDSTNPWRAVRELSGKLERISSLRSSQPEEFAEALRLTNSIERRYGGNPEIAKRVAEIKPVVAQGIEEIRQRGYTDKGIAISKSLKGGFPGKEIEMELMRKLILECAPERLGNERFRKWATTRSAETLHEFSAIIGAEMKSGVAPDIDGAMTRADLSRTMRTDRGRPDLPKFAEAFAEGQIK